jgi:hypothetical protein
MTIARSSPGGEAARHGPRGRPSAWRGDQRHDRRPRVVNGTDASVSLPCECGYRGRVALEPASQCKPTLRRAPSIMSAAVQAGGYPTLPSQQATGLCNRTPTRRLPPSTQPQIRNLPNIKPRPVPDQLPSPPQSAASAHDVPVYIAIVVIASYAPRGLHARRRVQAQTNLTIPGRNRYFYSKSFTTCSNSCVIQRCPGSVSLRRCQ